jgi:GNAT superfamily N-acetyltransferase
VPWRDVAAVVAGANCHGDRCYCQRFKVGWNDWRSYDDLERAQRLREQTRARPSCGLVAYVENEPAGWCRVEPRSGYVSLGKTPWTRRPEERKNDDSVWAVGCLIVRAGFRRQGIMYPLVGAAVDFARECGARALEGYPMLTEPGKDIAWGELHVGSRNAFEAAGFAEVSHPTKRRFVMRIDF